MPEPNAMDPRAVQRGRDLLRSMVPDLAAHDDALDQQEREEDVVYARRTGRCLSCQSDQLRYIGPEMTLVGELTRYACQSCGQETLR